MNINNILKFFFYYIKKNIFNYKNFLSKNLFLYYLTIIIFIYWFINGFNIINETDKGILLRFGKFNSIRKPGINWIIYGVDKLKIINTNSIKNLNLNNKIFTLDENILFVDTNVQYIIYDIKKYLFNINKIDYNLKYIINNVILEYFVKYKIENILKKNEYIFKKNIHNILNKTIKNYDIGIKIVNLNFNKVSIPDEIKKEFDEVELSKNIKNKYIEEAKKYVNKIRKESKIKAKKIIEESKLYELKKIYSAKIKFEYLKNILLSYKLYPNITKEKIYSDNIKKYLKNVKKIIIDNNKSSIIINNNKK